MNNVTVKAKEAARMLGLSASTLAKMRMRGRGPAFVRVSSRCVLYRVSDIEAWLDARVSHGPGR